ncbi:MAG: gamma-glutamylcyclotransferase family protein [Planctomycetota bacterium]
MTVDGARRLPLFVFGTLRRGERNHHYLRGRFTAVCGATLPGYAVVAPLMIDRREGGTVSGELFELDGSRFDETLADVDSLEGISPGETRGPDYERAVVRVEAGGRVVEAYAYVAAGRSLPAEDA